MPRTVTNAKGVLPRYHGTQRSSCWKLVVVCLCRVSYSVTSPTLSVFWLSYWLNSLLQQQGKSAQAPELTFREWLQPGAWLTSNSIHHTYRVRDLWRGRSSFTLIHWLKQGDDSSHRHTGSSRPIHRSKFSSNGTKCRDLWRGWSSFTLIHRLEQESFVMVKNHVAFHEKGPPPKP
jgi:hypothetical protein